jgi:hypothetical protein
MWEIISKQDFLGKYGPLSQTFLAQNFHKKKVNNNQDDDRTLLTLCTFFALYQFSHCTISAPNEY